MLFKKRQNIELAITFDKTGKHLDLFYLPNCLYTLKLSKQFNKIEN